MFGNRHMAYILVGREVIPATTTEASLQLENIEARRIGYTKIANEVWVSTVFIGLDHAFTGPPLVFETMVFAPFDEREDSMNLDGERYSTYAQAERGHQLWTERATERYADRNTVEEWTHRPSPLEKEE